METWGPVLRIDILHWHLFNRVLGIIESGLSGTRVLKLSELVLRINESSFSNPQVLKSSDLVLRTSESSLANREFTELVEPVLTSLTGCLYNLLL